MTRRVRLLATTMAVIGLVATNGFAFAPSRGKGQDSKGHAHGSPTKGTMQVKDYSGKALLGDDIKKDGSHKLQDHGKYSASVTVFNGTITGFVVTHADKGSVPVTKYKATKKKVRGVTSGVQLASYFLPESQYTGTMLIGYGYIDDWREESIYWFPCDMIENANAGAIEFYSAN